MLLSSTIELNAQVHKDFVVMLDLCTQTQAKREAFRRQTSKLLLQKKGSAEAPTPEDSVEEVAAAGLGKPYFAVLGKVTCQQEPVYLMCGSGLSVSGFPVTGIKSALLCFTWPCQEHCNSCPDGLCLFVPQTIVMWTLQHWRAAWLHSNSR